MENISGNIANSQTIGYKKIDTSFVDLIPDAPVKSQVPGAVTSYSKSTNTLRGDIQNAETETYMALNGSGFFVVEPASGDTSTAYYTRRGDFDIDKDGYLVNGAGFRLKGLAMSGGVITGSVAQAIKIDNSFLPAKRTTAIDYQLNLPQTPKNASYVATTPGSELMKPWNYGGVSPTPYIASTTGAGLPTNVPAATEGTSVSGSSQANTMVSNNDSMTVNVGGTAVTLVFDTDGTVATTAPNIEIDASGTVSQLLANIQAALAGQFGAGNDPVVGLKSGKVHFTLPDASTAALSITSTRDGASLQSGPVLDLDGSFTPITGASITAANTPADLVMGNGDVLTFDIGGTIRSYKIDTDGTQTAAAGQTKINATGSLADMLAAIQADLRINGGPGSANAVVEVSGGAISVAFNGNYTLPVAISGTGATSLGLAGTYTPQAGTVDRILATDSDAFIKESIAGGGITVYSTTGEPVNVQLRWAKTSNEAGNESWSLFYASDSRSGAAYSWTKLADYSFDQGVLDGITPNTAVATANGTQQLNISNLTINGTSLGSITIDHGLKGMTQFADNSGAATTTTLKQNGYSAGEFISVGISDNGRVVASYTNGENREVAQIVIATFNDPNALKRGDGGTYTATSQSGEAVLSQSGDGIVGSSTEASNTDISEEFTKLIVTQQAYAANTRIVSAANDMLQETLNMMR